MKLKLTSAWLLALVLLQGCAILGVPPADTFNKRAVVANGLVEQASKTVETLFVAGKLSPEDATQYNQRTKDAATGIDLARELHVSDPVAADARLTAIEAALTALKSELERRQ
jgi:hypothetical protein